MWQHVYLCLTFREVLCFPTTRHLSEIKVVIHHGTFSPLLASSMDEEEETTLGPSSVDHLNAKPGKSAWHTPQAPWQGVRASVESASPWRLCRVNAYGVSTTDLSLNSPLKPLSWNLSVTVFSLEAVTGYSDIIVSLSTFSVYLTGSLRVVTKHTDPLPSTGSL